MEIIKLKIADLTPYENNAKEHPKKQVEEIKNSIKQFGFCDPVGIWGEKNIIVEGHGRVLALQEMGETEVECIRLDHLTDDERKAYTLAHNKTTLSSDFDFEKLEAELKELQTADLDFSMADFGFDLSEFEEETEIVEDEIPEVDEESEPITQLGDIWQLGDHRLICGDSTDRETVERLMDGVKADMCFTDPPYNCNYGNIKHPKFKVREIENDNMDSQSFRNFCIDFISNIKLFTTGCVYMCAGQGQDGRVMFSVADELLHNSTTIIWNKDQFTLGRGKYQNKYEPIWFGWVESGADFTEDRTLTNVWDIKRPKKSELHPTMKPIEIMATALRHNPKSKKIIDLFGGSGSTLIACEQLNRVCYMCELDPKYCDVIVKRWETLTGKKANKIKGE